MCVIIWIFQQLDIYISKHLGFKTQRYIVIFVSEQNSSKIDIDIWF